jgi:hypothetical protein
MIPGTASRAKRVKQPADNGQISPLSGDKGSMLLGQLTREKLVRQQMKLFRTDRPAT